MDQKGAKRKANTPPDLSDRNPPNPADSSSDSHISNMERLFAEDKMREEETGPSALLPEQPTVDPQQGAPVAAVYYQQTVIWMKNDETSQRVAVSVHKGSRDDSVYFLMNGHNRVVLRLIRVDDAEFEFDLEDNHVLVRRKDPPRPEDLRHGGVDPSNSVRPAAHIFPEAIRLLFPDTSSITFLCMTILLRSSTHEHFLLRSSGRREGDEFARNEPEVLIDEGHEVSYVRSKYITNGDNTIGPDMSNRRKVLDRDKLDSDHMYKWFGGHQKGASFAIKVGNAAYRIEIAKLKTAESSSEGTPPSDEGISLASGREREERPIPEDVDPRADDDDNGFKIDEEVVSTSPDPAAATAPALLNPTPAPRSIHVHPPLPPSSPTPFPRSDDLRDALHRIVGIELDRIEMRLNAKFEQLQTNINTRLDRQTELLQKLVLSTVQETPD